MANITAQMVKELRERTGAGMMDCKAALQETAGAIEQAVDLLRKRGLAKAAKKAGRIAAEGLIGVAMEDSKGVVVEAVGPDVEKIKAAKVGDITLAEAIADTIAKIGENMSLRRASSLSVANGVIGSYVHNSVEQGLGKIGVLVALQSTGKGEELKRFGRMLAMHVAASNPQAIEASGLDPDLVRREREVLADKYRSQGKPPNVIDKIVESGLKTFYKEVCLVDQAYIHDPDKTVSQAIKDSEGKLGAPIRVTGFIRYALGEGIDRPDSDFGGEVAALVTSS